MAGGHVCSLDPNCHDHSLLKTIDNTAKWFAHVQGSALYSSEIKEPLQQNQTQVIP